MELALGRSWVKAAQKGFDYQYAQAAKARELVKSRYHPRLAGGDGTKGDAGVIPPLLIHACLTGAIDPEMIIAEQIDRRGFYPTKLPIGISKGRGW
jgi:hypothetical protein